MRYRKAVPLALVLVLALPATAAAHARLVGSKPADGAVLATPPRDVRVLFDDGIRPAGGERAVDARGRSVLAGKAERQGDRAIVIPVRRNLRRGSYTVRWRVVSDDGHPISGVLAFAVGAGSPRPVPTLSAAGTGPSASGVLLRLLFLAGVLVAGGAALTARVLGVPRRPETVVVGLALGFVALAGFGLLALEPAADATRFGRVTEVTAIAAAVGWGAAVLSLALPGLGVAAAVLGIAVLAAPTLAGHALDPRRLRALIALADVVHLAAAAVWIGGLVLLAVSGSAVARRRFPWIAAGAVGVLGAASIARAAAAFPSFSSLVDTGYGRAVLIKTGIVAAVLALGWANRQRLARLGFFGELVLLAGIVAAVAVLTDLRPPQRSAVAAAPAPPSSPPPDALVLAAQDDNIAVGLAVSPRGSELEARVTALGPEGAGVDGLDVGVAGVSTEPCGPGCYSARIALPPPPRRVPVRVGDRTIVFSLPARWPAPSAAAVVRRVDRVFRSLHTLVIHERLASSARNRIVTTFRVEAPDRLAYRIARGPQAVVIGGTRWDKLPGGRWERSETDPLKQPEPFWGDDPIRNARLLGRGRASFYDPRLPAWFELTFDPGSGRLRGLKMTATAHFMRHRYAGFNAPFRIVPPR